MQVRLKIVFILLLFFIHNNSFAQSWNNDSILLKLDEALVTRIITDNNKIQQIGNELIKLQQLGDDQLEERYIAADKLYNEYKSYTYDSAFKYVLYLDDLATRQKDILRVSSAKIKMGFIFLSSGLFKEALDTLMSVDPAKLNRDMQIDYYSILGRTYHDLSDYDGSSFFTTIYNRKGNFYLKKAIELVPENSFQYYQLYGAEQLKAGQFESARETFRRLYDSKTMTEHQRAITASTLGYIYSCLKKDDEAIYLLAIASIADINSSTKETVALRNLAHLLNDKGDTERAHRYIKIALADADFYNARHRKKEVGIILPIIEGEQLRKTEKQKEQLILYLILSSIFGALAVAFLIISTIQFYRLKRVKELLQITNSTITDTNKKLSEANRIKEKYIGYYFNVTANYMERIEKIQKKLSRRIISRQFDDLDDFLKRDLDPKKELDELNNNFDKIVLSLFPNFVIEFNKLFNPEDQFIPKEGQILNKELRIFALIRMGISDNEKIAKILNFSVNTIYTYKTKIKNRSIVTNNEFEEHLMKIDA